MCSCMWCKQWATWHTCKRAVHNCSRVNSHPCHGCLRTINRFPTLTAVCPSISLACPDAMTCTSTRVGWGGALMPTPMLVVSACVFCCPWHCVTPHPSVPCRQVHLANTTLPFLLLSALISKVVPTTTSSAGVRTPKEVRAAADDMSGHQSSLKRVCGKRGLVRGMHDAGPATKRQDQALHGSTGRAHVPKYRITFA